MAIPVMPLLHSSHCVSDIEASRSFYVADLEQTLRELRAKRVKIVHESPDRSSHPKARVTNQKSPSPAIPAEDSSAIDLIARVPEKRRSKGQMIATTAI